MATFTGTSRDIEGKNPVTYAITRAEVARLLKRVRNDPLYRSVRDLPGWARRQWAIDSRANARWNSA